MGVEQHLTTVIELMKDEFGAGGWSIRETTERIMNITDDTTRNFTILAYLTGGRREEICKYNPRRHLKKQDTIKELQPDNTIKKNRHKWVIPNPEYGHRLQGIRKKDIAFEPETGCLTVVLRNLKNRKLDQKRNQAYMINEGILIQELLRFIQPLKDDEEVIPYTSDYMYKLMKKYAPDLKRPHFLRAVRTQHLVDLYNFTDIEIKDWNGWSNTLPLDVYRFLFNNNKRKDKMSVKVE